MEEKIEVCVTGSCSYPLIQGADTTWEDKMQFA